MSARDELLESLLPWGRRPADGEEEACNALIDAFAHELAEKIRTRTLEAPEGFVHRQAWVDAWNEGRDDMADLIDPEVS